MKRQHLTWIKRSTAALGALTIAVWGTLFALTGAPSASADAASTSSQLLNLSDHATALPSGPVIVEAMAPWCEYCATTAKWLDVSDARWAHAHHLPWGQYPSFHHFTVSCLSQSDSPTLETEPPYDTH